MAVVINGDTGITSVNGTAAAPSITGADTNTGIVYGADTLSLVTGGTTAVTVNSTQNVTLAAGLTVTGSATAASLQVGGVATNVYPLVLGSAITSATGSSLDFPSIPSWVKRITISLNGISFAALGIAVVRLGVSNILVTTGYVAARVGFTTTPAMVYTAVTDGVASFGTTVAAAAATGQIVITNLTGNQWVASGQVTRTTDNVYMPTTGSITLAGTLTNLSVVATTSTFDAGSVNIMYE